VSAEGKNGGQVRGQAPAKTHAERKKVLSVSRRQKWWPSKKKANWAPGPCANFQEITMENMPVLPLEES
jgi:hypothetical protein